MRDVRLAVGQWPVARDLDANLDAAERFLRRAANDGAALCVLPEMFNAPYELPVLRTAGEPQNGRTVETLRALARELELWIVGGSLCETPPKPHRPSDERGHLHNTSFVIAADGEIQGVHRKIHLFDVDVAPTDGRPGVTVCESNLFTPGERPLVLTTPFGTLGVAVCYDVRFPEVFAEFERRGVEIVAIPAAFSNVTGTAHWHLVMRGRAVDYQVFLAAALPSPIAREQLRRVWTLARGRPLGRGSRGARDERRIVHGRIACRNAGARPPRTSAPRAPASRSLRNLA